MTHSEALEHVDAYRRRLRAVVVGEQHEQLPEAIGAAFILGGVYALLLESDEPPDGHLLDLFSEVREKLETLEARAC